MKLSICVFSGVVVWAASAYQGGALRSPSTPSPIRVVATPYPRLAHLADAQGDVHLAVTIASGGAVSKVDVTSGASLLRDSARTMVSQWIFSPCVEAQPCQAQVILHYVLEAGMCADSDCPSTFQFDLPSTVTIRANHRPAIVN